MTFRTQIEPIKANFQVNLQSKILTIGSCFSEVIGQELAANKLNCLVNPFGTVFNPISIFKLLSQAQINERLFLENADGVWLHHDFHSQFWAKNKEELHKQLNQKLSEVQTFLKQADLLIITFGTAFVYQLAESQIVSNCHKQAAKNFKKDLLSIKDICKAFAELYRMLIAQNPKTKILLTVSPVRHTKDTLTFNNLSKSILRGACHYLQSDFEGVSYFPAYEIMLDDLRDYRFYKPDLIHPNEVAEQYIFERFAETYFEPNLKTFISDWQKIRRALQHRPQQVDTPSYYKFQQDLKAKIEKMASLVDVKTEIESLSC